MDLGLKGMVAVVAGGSSGIGAAVARKFGAEGAKVALTYRGDASGADRVVREIERLGGEAMSIRYDLNDDHSMEQAVQAVAGKWGSIHVLVNNDVRWPEPRQLAFEDVSPESWRQEIRANLEGYYFTIQQALPYIRK
ncbi:Ketoreductase, Oxidoreductase, short chain dehydrogenase/reductase family protein [Thermobacillus xylanilyticus]|uniref:Ketoreductase, Oxidoreductase, short chain dehydrogenase/reductase family protein n=1 Tax=Thermobacillus xylanilyticus TaxID=76633 RepID=A0ABN7RLC4_THEXY|nr:Ketoreductase, Oxidoreductase, short chain dehydrogenase/reductase family protein [Thermobacillus xylanilyticus]